MNEGGEHEHENEHETPSKVLYMLRLDSFTGTEMTMDFNTSRETPAEYKPMKMLGHNLTASLKIKFFSTFNSRLAVYISLNF